jgi:ABC-2 type transport system ATP-binding protein
MSVIEMRELRKDFTVRVRAGLLRRTQRTVPAVDGIDLAIEVGEMVGYIGPNGAGKSTTLKMLTGVLSPSAGRVSVCGLTPVPQRTKLALRIGVVFGQRSQLWWDLPLRESFVLLRHVYRCRPPIMRPGCGAALRCSTWARSWTPRSVSCRWPAHAR